MPDLIETIASRLSKLPNGQFTLADDDIAKILTDLAQVGDPRVVFELVGELTRVTAFFERGGSKHVATAINEKILPAVAGRALQLAQGERSGITSSRRPEAPKAVVNVGVGQALQPSSQKTSGQRTVGVRARR